MRFARTVLPTIALLAGLTCVGQEPKPADLPMAPSASQKPKRLLGVIPQHSVGDLKHVTPLTAAEKWKLFTRETFDPFDFALVGAEAGLGQARDEFPGYGQGAEGYGRRYGASFADEAAGDFFGKFLFPVLLKEDPRYFRMGDGTFQKRLGYSLSRTLVTRTDAGKSRFNFSKVLGTLAAGGLANAYYPEEDRGAALTFERAGTVMAIGTLGSLATEFWPDVWRKLRHKKDEPPVR